MWTRVGVEGEHERQALTTLRANGEWLGASKIDRARLAEWPPNITVALHPRCDHFVRGWKRLGLREAHVHSDAEPTLVACSRVAGAAGLVQHDKGIRPVARGFLFHGRNV